jgi:hypothetical protein
MITDEKKVHCTHLFFPCSDAVCAFSLATFPSLPPFPSFLMTRVGFFFLRSCSILATELAWLVGACYERWWCLYGCCVALIRFAGMDGCQWVAMGGNVVVMGEREID